MRHSNNNNVVIHCLVLLAAILGTTISTIITQSSSLGQHGTNKNHNSNNSVFGIILGVAAFSSQKRFLPSLSPMPSKVSRTSAGSFSSNFIVGKHKSKWRTCMSTSFNQEVSINNNPRPNNVDATEPKGSFRNIAILLPEEEIEIGDDDNNSQWRHEALSHLQMLSNQLQIPIISTTKPNDSSNYDNHHADSNLNDFSHYITTIPYPRTNSYALAIHANPTTSTQNKKTVAKKKIQKKIKLDPFHVDLCPPSDTRLGYRMNANAAKNNSNKNSNNGDGEELLIKALGWKKILFEKNNANENGEQSSKPLIVHDLTAGLGRDSLIILTSSFAHSQQNENDGSLQSFISSPEPIQLHMVERDPIVAALVSDAMRRLQLLSHDADIADATATNSYNYEQSMARRLMSCLTFEEGDAVSVLNHLSTNSEAPFPPDICYLDPMFPPRKKKSSAVKKDMAMLHSLLGTSTATPSTATTAPADAQVLKDVPNDLPTDEIIDTEQVRLFEEQSLLHAACKSAVRRVVVKRPIGAPPLGYSSVDGENNDSKNANGSNNSSNASNVRKPSYDVRGSVNRWDVYINS